MLADAARAVGVPLVWLSLDVPEAVAVARVAARHEAGTDASDASADVVRSQFRSREPIDAEEFGRGPAGEPLESLVSVASADLGDPTFVERLVERLLDRHVDRHVDRILDRLHR
jgi:hypothetical protein